MTLLREPVNIINGYDILMLYLRYNFHSHIVHVPFERFALQFLLQHQLLAQIPNVNVSEEEVGCH